MSEQILRIKNLRKTYKNSVALDNVDLTINKGEIYGFIGENGAGKTTLIRMITGLGEPDSGEIELFGETNKQKIRNQRKKLGCIIESPALYLDMTAEQNLEVIRIQRRITNPQCVNDVLKLVKLEGTKSKKVKNFSLGMKQRLALAIALLGNPEFLILDEPLNGLDPSGIIEFRELIKYLNKEIGVTVLISSHLLGELTLLATSYAFINSGKVVEQISHKELTSKCTKHIELIVDNVNSAVDVLRENLDITDYKVDYELQNIKIYTQVNSPKVISKEMIRNNIGIESINVISDDLEGYFKNLIQEVSHV